MTNHQNVKKKNCQCNQRKFREFNSYSGIEIHVLNKSPMNIHNQNYEFDYIHTN